MWKSLTFIIIDSFFLQIYDSQDTRTHVVVELFNTEQSYVDSLEIVVLVTDTITAQIVNLYNPPL